MKGVPTARADLTVPCDRKVLSRTSRQPRPGCRTDRLWPVRCSAGCRGRKSCHALATVTPRCRGYEIARRASQSRLGYPNPLGARARQARAVAQVWGLPTLFPLASPGMISLCRYGRSSSAGDRCCETACFSPMRWAATDQLRPFSRPFSFPKCGPAAFRSWRRTASAALPARE